MKLTHVIFADDIFLFCKGDGTSIKAMLDSVARFSTMSGLNANSDKSTCFFCNVSSRLTKSDCMPLVDRLCGKIEAWTANSLRYSGRLQLIKSVLFGIQGYWSSFVFLPKGILKLVQSCLARFLWGGGVSNACHYKVAWSDCCIPKQEGGLGLRNVFSWNTAAILNQVWRLAQPTTNSLWLLWVHSCLLKRKSFWTTRIPYKCPWNLRKILNQRTQALQFLNFRIGTNSRFKLWHDPWFL